MQNGFGKFAVTLCAVYLLSPLAHAQMAIGACPNFPAPEVVVTGFFETLTYDFSKDMMKMRQLSVSHASESLQQPVGLATGELSIGLVMQSNLSVSTDGQVCARPKMLHIDAGFQHSTIYVTRELPQNSCGYREVLAHEEGHIAIDRQLLADYRARLTQFAQQAVQQLGTVSARSQAEADKQMQDFINAKLQDVGQEMNRERDRRQALHDSPEEYTRLGKVCNGEIALAVRRYGAPGTIVTQVQTDNAHAAAPITAPQTFTRY